jgi:hypothetical protein
MFNNVFEVMNRPYGILWFRHQIKSFIVRMDRQMKHISTLEITGLRNAKIARRLENVNQPGRQECRAFNMVSTTFLNVSLPLTQKQTPHITYFYNGINL